MQGSLNPILDSLGRTYVYARNISVNDGQAQPVHFIYGEELKLTDSNGQQATLQIMHMAGKSALLRWRR